jgi:hypothetical protein
MSPFKFLPPPPLSHSSHCSMRPKLAQSYSGLVFWGKHVFLIPPSLSVAALYCHSIGWIRLEQLVAFPYNRALRLTQLRSLLRSTAYSNGPRRIGYEFGRNAGSRVYLNRLKFVLIYDDFTYTLMKRGPPPHEQTNRLLCPGICHRT